MDTDNPVIKLCIEGSQAEYERKLDRARELYQRAWDIASDDYEACIAAHYLARRQSTPEDTLHWNQTALHHADLTPVERVRDFYPSLYLTLGHSLEELGQVDEAKRYYALSADHLDDLLSGPDPNFDRNSSPSE